ncbi:microtubule associated protein 1a [Volvox carteri f. nagariensis]|uniref:Microtubule associated protein 1a n=1 Tax=Volvox carteri f. nagariensis TaxID=3068 RepID=D8UGY7_VOLCA|nr:microtubule associated protein 1a [Volvox carteri f. nagariensis]EFJ41062.1 microtubule associated protein 1a [Volvox carteri f. nagariensis]|eukprot:XP_002957926.1 microtubule associated protein 1a [Volvox carteri f. nagariensis]
MATAIELAIQNGNRDLVTILLTDAKRWYFASVQLVGEISQQGLPRPTRNEFQACGYRFRLFACKYFSCDLLHSGGSSPGLLAKVFARIHNVLYPGVDISQVAAQVERGRDVLQTLADKWAEPFIVEIDRRQAAEQEKTALVQTLKFSEEENITLVQKLKSLEEEKKALVQKLKSSEEEKKALTQEKKGLAQEKKALAQEKKALAWKLKLSEQKEKALAQEKKATVKDIAGLKRQLQQQGQ